MLVRRRSTLFVVSDFISTPGWERALAQLALRHDVTAGLFAPVELLIVDEEDDRSSLTYVVPSSLMVVEANEGLREAALGLDAKLAALAAKVTAA